MGWGFKFKDFERIILVGDFLQIRIEGETLRVRVTGFDTNPQNGDEPEIIGEILGITHSSNFYCGYEISFGPCNVIN